MVTLTPRKSRQNAAQSFTLTLYHYATPSRQSETLRHVLTQFPRRQVDKFKHGLPAAEAYRNLVEVCGEHARMNRTLQSFSRRDMRIEERRAGPRKSSLKTKVLRETVQVQHTSDVHELVPTLEKYDSRGSRHFAQIERKELPHALIWCCGKRKDLCWTGSLRAMNNGVPTLTRKPRGASRMTSTHHQTDEAPKMLEEFGINLIPHPAYSADLSPTDYHFFSLSKYMSTRKCIECWKD
ncbi:hypothetical protein M514_11879 [Trichuris suis]|uniref:Mos1 transposase HTH domain-containing protein n=1 Tax=Trichuris suis TaxID=68888 RepID=A0A085NIH9_9BILA|nr:hypothetical protein M514_11879 [Trichuris suis]